ncbi:helix-turn-helix transcriptional regulator [Austwickia chelonae]|uniref:helix-turn-helix transcriptional regulator n=1 Tax=Austwickia chelonae TaxID=100225 RepID=UPI000E2533CE|nr:helix-turn-helix domain-containing protein [Austwickia chelonae]
MSRRFLPLSEVCEMLAISSAQGYALVRSGELPAIQIGGRGQWRVDTEVLEDFIQGKYAEQQAAAKEHREARF